MSGGDGGAARDVVLGRIRTALRGAEVPGGAGEPGGAGGYRTRDGRTGAELADLLAERLGDYGSRVRRCAATALAGTVAAALAERGVRRAVVPPGLAVPGAAGLAARSAAARSAAARSAAKPAGGIEVVVDDGFGASELELFDAVITTAALAIAETGTIVLDGSAGQGRRALSLVPDYHLCVVRTGQIVGLVTEAVAVLDPRCPLTWISGPSATSDIELDRVEGVHGPRTLEVILVGPELGE